MTDDYSAFQEWYETLNWIMRTEKYPKDVRFSSRTGSCPLPSDYSRKLMRLYTQGKTESLKEHKPVVEKLRIFFRLSYDRKYIL